MKPDHQVLSLGICASELNVFISVYSVVFGERVAQWHAVSRLLKTHWCHVTVCAEENGRSTELTFMINGGEKAPAHAGRPEGSNIHNRHPSGYAVAHERT